MPTIEPLKPCYVTAGTAENPQGEGVQINAQGFTPNSKVDLALDGQPVPGRRGPAGRRDGGILTLPPFAGAVRRERLDATSR